MSRQSRWPSITDQTKVQNASVPGGKRTGDNRAWPKADKGASTNSAVRPTYTNSPSDSRSTPPELHKPTEKLMTSNQKPAGNSSSSVPTPTHTHNTTTHHACAPSTSLLAPLASSTSTLLCECVAGAADPPASLPARARGFRKRLADR